MKKVVFLCALVSATIFSEAVAHADICIDFPVGNATQFPSEGFCITQGFAAYNHGFGGYHSGTDISNGSEGAPVYSVSHGQVTNIIYDCSHGSGWGTLVRIRHQLPSGTVYYSQYAHLQCSSLAVGIGQWVDQGQFIARIGNTGASSGPHLHFEIKDHDTNGNGYYPSHPEDYGFYDPISFIYDRRSCDPPDPSCDCFTPPCGCIVYN